MDGENTKHCGGCSQDLPPTAFARNRVAKDGLQSRCKACSARWAREHRPRKRELPPSTGTDEKWCRRCTTVKPLADFGPHRSTTDRKQTYCRSCFADIYRQKRQREGYVVKPAHVPEGHKFCRGCQTVLPLTMWAARSTTTDGLAFQCKTCVSAKDRGSHLARTYGLSVADIDRMLAAQHGVCAICHTAPAIHVDHDHRTGSVRGMLCFRCNAALGQFDDDPLVLRRAARYLERSPSAERPTARPTWHGAPAEPSLLERRLRERLAETDLGTAS